MMIGAIEKQLIDNIEDEGAIHITLLDPEKITPETASLISLDAESSRTSAIMIGGSTVYSTHSLDLIVKKVKDTVDIPIILFPNNITGISRYADALWFMSLLNSNDPYFLTGAQILGAPIVKEFGLEPIPLGYIVIGEGRTVGVIARATPIPYDKSELAVAHALAAQFLGMHFVYLEAGSGAKQTVPLNMINDVKKAIDIPLIVGGGIRTGDQARNIVNSGADIIVTGTITEESEAKNTITSIVNSIRKEKRMNY